MRPSLATVLGARQPLVAFRSPPRRTWRADFHPPLASLSTQKKSAACRVTLGGPKFKAHDLQEVFSFRPEVYFVKFDANACRADRGEFPFDPDPCLRSKLFDREHNLLGLCAADDKKAKIRWKASATMDGAGAHSQPAHVVFAT